MKGLFLQQKFNCFPNLTETNLGTSMTCLGPKWTKKITQRYIVEDTSVVPLSQVNSRPIKP